MLRKSDMERIIAALLVASGMSFADAKSKKVRLTILDTLNAGREVSISHDYEAPKPPPPVDTVKEEEVAQPVAEPEEDTVERKAGVVLSYYEIQIIATRQKALARQEKKKLIAKTKLPVSISYEPPYYKVYVGRFLERSEAENQLKQIKNLGYNDAWIARIAAGKR
jgi:cell division septation protein DedD